MMPNKICVNYDWFEVFTYRPLDFDDSVLESLGFRCEVRDFGTRVYKKMFTVFHHGLPWIEFRMFPVSGALDSRACHVRLVNRSCYQPNCVGELYEFLAGLGFRYRDAVAIPSRVDICLDFLSFDNDLKCHVFLNDYMAGKYAKINQPRLRAFGTDFFDSKVYHAVNWGSPASMVSTKLYLKTKELNEEKMKPYIVDAWVNAGLLHDIYDETDVWRLEFSISSDCKFWLEENASGFIQSNSFEFYCSRKNLLSALKGLVSHYFQFCIPVSGISKYKCERVSLLSLEGDAYLPRPTGACRTGNRTLRIFRNFLQSLKHNPSLPQVSNDIVDDMERLLSLLYAPRDMVSYNALADTMVQERMREFGRRLCQIVDRTESAPFECRSAALTLLTALENNEILLSVFQQSQYSITAVEFSESVKTEQNNGN